MLCIQSHIQAQYSINSAIEIKSPFESFTYSDTRNTASGGYSNQYGYYNTNEVFYKLTLSKPMVITITNCGSALADTYIMLFKLSAQQIPTVFSSSGSSTICSSKTNGSITQTLEPGTYWICCKGKSQNGSITTNVEGISKLENPELHDLGTKSEAFTYTHRANTVVGANKNPVTSMNDVYYKFRIAKRMKITVTHKGTSLRCTVISLLGPDDKVRFLQIPEDVKHQMNR
ncbi:MAG: hypothetical protein LIP01_15695 [Tannerellaceae bacterium]|nr:hypothetical protein [Tannerellaceae bacterium]